MKPEPFGDVWASLRLLINQNFQVYCTVASGKSINQKPKTPKQPKEVLGWGKLLLICGRALWGDYLSKAAQDDAGAARALPRALPPGGAWTRKPPEGADRSRDVKGNAGMPLCEGVFPCVDSQLKIDESGEYWWCAVLVGGTPGQG